MQNNDQRDYDDFRSVNPRTPPAAYMVWLGVLALAAVIAFGVFALMTAEAAEYHTKDLTKAHMCETVVIGTEAWCSKSD